MRWNKVASSAAFCASGFALAALVLPARTGAADKKPARITSSVVRFDEAARLDADWGELRSYFTGETHGTKGVLTAVAVIEPGKFIHQAHRHVEEEYLAIVQGEGTWHLAGKEFPAQRGDIQYIEPWVYHGLENTGDAPLIFVVVKFAAKGVKHPARPNDGKKDEL